MTNDASTRRRWLALVFPWLPVDRLRGTRPHLFVARDESPLALVEKVGQTVRLTSVDRLAAQAGLTAGLTLAEARTRVPEVDVFEADPHADHEWLEQLADGCARYTPTVLLLPPDVLLLDITGCADPHGGERPLAADVEARLARRGVLVRHAFGDTPDTAQALARFAGAPAPDEARAIRRLPVAALGLDTEGVALLLQAGLKTIGDVMARPLSGVAAQFGQATATAVRQLSGGARTPGSLRRIAAPVMVERHLGEPLCHGEGALSVIAELAAEAATTLAVRHEGGRRWEARLFRADGQVRRLLVETGQATRDVAALTRLFRERIDGPDDLLDPRLGYDLIRLNVLLTERLDATYLALQGGAAHEDQKDEAGETPRVRPGRGRARRFAAREGIPEQAELMLPPALPTPAPDRIPADPGEPPRPIHLFDPPQPIDAVAADTPDGPPTRFRWRRKMHDVARSEGPERMAGEWWRRHNAAVPPRDYFRVEDQRGRRFWIFRHGVSGETNSPRWFLHGLFA